MKAVHLSSFQKEQYTQYLETQLQNFSCFMLNQRKENQRNKHWQNIIVNQNQKIKDMQNKLSLMTIYHEQNCKETQRLKESSYRMFQNIESRLKRVEGIYCSTILNNQKKEQNDLQSIERLNDLQNLILSDINAVSNNLQRKIHKLQFQFANSKQLQSSRGKYSLTPTTNHQFKTIQERDRIGLNEMATKKDLKKVEKKLREFFLCNFQKIQNFIFNKKKKQKETSDKSKSIFDKQNNRNSVNITQFDKSTHKISEKQTKNIQNQKSKPTNSQPQSVLILQRSITPSEKTSVNDMQQLKSKIQSYFDAHKVKLKKKTKKRNRSKSISNRKSNHSKTSHQISHSRSISRSQKSVSVSKSAKKTEKKSKQAKSKNKMSKPKDKNCSSMQDCMNQYLKCCKKKHF